MLADNDLRKVIAFVVGVASYHICVIGLLVLVASLLELESNAHVRLQAY